jgi:hypothetical protein
VSSMHLHCLRFMEARGTPPSDPTEPESPDHTESCDIGNHGRHKTQRWIRRALAPSNTDSSHQSSAETAVKQFHSECYAE